MYGDGGFFFLKPVGAGAVEPVREYGYHMAPHGLAGFGAATSGARTEGAATAGRRYQFDDAPFHYPELQRFYRKMKALKRTGRFSENDIEKVKKLIDASGARPVDKSMSRAAYDSMPESAFRQAVDNAVANGSIRALPFGFSKMPSSAQYYLGAMWTTYYVGPRVEAAKARSASSSTTSTVTASASAAPRFTPSSASLRPSAGAGMPSMGTRGAGTLPMGPSSTDYLTKPLVTEPTADAGITLAPTEDVVAGQPSMPTPSQTPTGVQEVIGGTGSLSVATEDESFLSKYGLLIAGGVLVTGAVAYYYRDSLGFGAGQK